jgi:hypothetical protein
MLDLIKVSMIILGSIIDDEDCRPDNAIDFDKCNPAGGGDVEPEPCDPDIPLPCNPTLEYPPLPCNPDWWG